MRTDAEAADVVAADAPLDPPIGHRLRFRLTDSIREEFAERTRTGFASEPRRIYTIYYDTPDARLWRQGIALRVRAVEGGYLQTIKVRPPGDTPLPAGRSGRSGRRGRLPADPFDGLQWERVTLTPHPEPAALPPASSPVGSIVRGCLPALGPVFETEVHRQTRIVVPEEGVRFELAADIGMIQAAGQLTEGLAEVELAQRAGPDGNFHRYALQWARLHQATLLTRTRHARGMALAGFAPALASPVPRRPVTPDGSVDVSSAARRLIGARLDQFVDELPGMLEADDPAGPHRLRAALRGLRAAIRFFDLREDKAHAQDLPWRAIDRLAARLLASATPVCRGDRLGLEVLPVLDAALPHDPALARLSAALAGWRDGGRTHLRDRLRLPMTTEFILLTAAALDGLAAPPVEAGPRATRLGRIEPEARPRLPVRDAQGRFTPSPVDGDAFLGDAFDGGAIDDRDAFGGGAFGGGAFGAEGFDGEAFDGTAFDTGHGDAGPDGAGAGAGAGAGYPGVPRRERVLAIFDSTPGGVTVRSGEPGTGDGEGPGLGELRFDVFAARRLAGLAARLHEQAAEAAISDDWRPVEARLTRLVEALGVAGRAGPGQQRPRRLRRRLKGWARRLAGDRALERTRETVADAMRGIQASDALMARVLGLVDGYGAFAHQDRAGRKARRRRGEAARRREALPRRDRIDEVDGTADALGPVRLSRQLRKLLRKSFDLELDGAAGLPPSRRQAGRSGATGSTGAPGPTGGTGAARVGIGDSAAFIEAPSPPSRWADDSRVIDLGDRGRPNRGIGDTIGPPGSGAAAIRPVDRDSEPIADRFGGPEPGRRGPDDVGEPPVDPATARDGDPASRERWLPGEPEPLPGLPGPRPFRSRGDTLRDAAGPGPDDGAPAR